jgi:8-oxo-dGTP pyrophosphatase MutT (NUDIX family)
VRREFSAGGVAVRKLSGRWMVAAIRPGGKAPGTWALPKGAVDPGEDPAATAVREVTEETGVRARLDRKLGDIRYVYRQSWEGGSGERVFKVVSFYLLRYSGGRLGEIAPEFEHEVAEVRWLPLEDAPQLLAYKGERQMAAKACEVLGG